MYQISGNGLAKNSNDRTLNYPELVLSNSLKVQKATLGSKQNKRMKEFTLTATLPLNSVSYPPSSSKAILVLLLKWIFSAEEKNN